MSERTVILLRHAEAGPPDAGQGDFERALTRQGRTQADQAGRWLRAHADWQAIPVLVSPARRTRETAEIALKGWHRGAVRTEDALWNASLGDYFELLSATSGDLLLVAHNPGLEQIHRAWTGMLLPVSVGSAHALRMTGDGRAQALDRFQPSRDAT